MSYPPAGGQPPYGAPPPPGGQPGYGYSPPPPTHLVWAILVTIFCCLPLGIGAIVFAVQVNSKWAAGDVQGAYLSSRRAKLFSIWAMILGLISGIGYSVWAFSSGGLDLGTY